MFVSTNTRIPNGFKQQNKIKQGIPELTELCQGLLTTTCHSRAAHNSFYRERRPWTKANVSVAEQSSTSWTHRSPASPFSRHARSAVSIYKVQLFEVWGQVGEEKKRGLEEQQPQKSLSSRGQSSPEIDVQRPPGRTGCFGNSKLFSDSASARSSSNLKASSRLSPCDLFCSSIVSCAPPLVLIVCLLLGGLCFLRGKTY